MPLRMTYSVLSLFSALPLTSRTTRCHLMEFSGLGVAALLAVPLIARQSAPSVCRAFTHLPHDRLYIFVKQLYRRDVIFIY